jgi:hypothetical protein
MKYRHRQAYAQKIPNVGCVRKHIGEELIVRGIVLVHIYIYRVTAPAASKLAEKKKKIRKIVGTTDQRRFPRMVFAGAMKTFGFIVSAPIRCSISAVTRGVYVPGLWFQILQFHQRQGRDCPSDEFN